jgi:hypothetical protein
MLDTEITCPECGLVLRVRDDGGVIIFNYAVSEWQRRCHRRDLGDPIWCLLQRDRTSPQKKINRMPDEPPELRSGGSQRQL